MSQIYKTVIKFRGISYFLKLGWQVVMWCSTFGYFEENSEFGLIAAACKSTALVYKVSMQSSNDFEKLAHLKLLYVLLTLVASSNRQ